MEEVMEKNIDGIEVPTYKKGNFIWTPLPAASEACVEEIRKA